MNGKEFKTWRGRFGLIQQDVADKFRVTRMTVQNWESSADKTIPAAVEMYCDVWEARLKQETPDLGPVTLVYSDGPMFVNPFGPRQRLAMMHQEPYSTNAWALARVQRLWGREDFHNPFILEESGKPLWNAVELARVVDGSDGDAPTLVNLLRRIAKSMRANPIVVRGAASPSQSEKEQRLKAIEERADLLDAIAAEGLDAAVRRQLEIEKAFSDLLALGTRAPDALVSNVAQALEALTPPRVSAPQPRLEQGGYIVDYKGFEISYPRTRLDSSGWTVNVASNNPHLFNRLGGRTAVIKDHDSLEGAVEKAIRHVDALI